MKKLLNRIFNNEILAYLIFGVATTIVSVATRLIVFQLTDQEQLATLIGKYFRKYFLPLLPMILLSFKTRKKKAG